ncbi:alpha/beta hydrolase [Caballeronia sordidicola]|uniref:Esterase/lipase n=1 Tax=Caballeronia sordidicola TaxID=196367 RepID=A0A242N788_CABSO|nr:alpha/beta hydrolase fold domain-containing protein [Caballeronia sordidicola]OTP79026.1 Esterase/lipase [Caballeronia sordidicola]
MTKLQEDPRIDPSIKKMFGDFCQPARADVSSRDEMLAQLQSLEGAAALANEAAFFRSTASEEIAPSTGLTIRTETFVSSPDGNTVKILFMRPEGDEVLPCVYYTHGGGMVYLSAFDDNYQAWGRIIASQGVAIAMADFRNALLPSSAREVAPFPAGLNDSVSGLRWVHDNAASLGIDSDRLIIGGDSGGGNLALATAMKLNRDGDVHRIKGVYSLCPFIAGKWPLPENPSSIENADIFISINSNCTTHGYGMEAFERQDPLAWPSFAKEDDVKGLPLVVININECDPLRDEGLNFYRFLRGAGVPARCRQMMGTVHATEVFPGCAPDVSYNTANDIAYLARTGR